MTAAGLRLDPVAPPDPRSIADGFTPAIPTGPGRYQTRWYNGSHDHTVTIVRHTRGHLVVIPDPPHDDACPLSKILPFELLWKRIA